MSDVQQAHPYTYRYEDETDQERTDDAPSSHQEQCDSHPGTDGRTKLQEIIQTDYDESLAYPGTLLAKEFKCSESSVRKIFNGLKQGLPVERLKSSKGYTHLFRLLLGEYFQRPEEQSAAAWFHELIDLVKSMTDAGISVKPGAALSKMAEKDKHTSIALRRDNLATLARLRGYSMDVEETEEQAFEAELEQLREKEYSKALRRKLVVLEAREQAEADIRGLSESE